jgi:hypothetical protein
LYFTKSARLSLPMKNLFGSMSENIQWKRGCVLFHHKPSHLEISVSSRTRPRNVKMVSISPKLKTAVCGWTGTAPRFWPSWNRWLGHVYQSGCSPHHPSPDSSGQRASE